MRALLRRLGPRYGVSLGLILLVVVIVVIARLGGHVGSSLVTTGGGGGVLPTASGLPDDGGVDSSAPVPPSTSPGAATPQTVATDFTTAWLHHIGVSGAAWLKAVDRYATERLVGQLADADPQTVPANRITGPLAVTDHSASWVEVAVPTDAGTLTLSLLADQGRWQVDAVDWNPA